MTSHEAERLERDAPTLLAWERAHREAHEADREVTRALAQLERARERLEEAMKKEGAAWCALLEARTFTPETVEVTP